MLKQQLTQEGVVTSPWSNAETTIHKAVTLTTTTAPGARINHRCCMNHVAETIRKQIPLLK
jgi:hypothetical protein